MHKNLIEKAKTTLIMLGALLSGLLCVWITVESHPYASNPKAFVANMVLLTVNYLPSLIAILLIWWLRKLNYAHLLVYSILLLGIFIGPAVLVMLAVKGIDNFVIQYPLRESDGK